MPGAHLSQDTDYVDVLPLEELPPGSLKQVEVDGLPIVVGNDDGLLFALSPWCSHEGSALALGSLSDQVLTCFAHQWSYDVRTGDPIWPPLARVAPGYRLRTYPVRVEGGRLLVSRRPGRLGLG